MRQANDFLMALQLTSANKLNHLSSFQVRLPALVIGGGLTCVDTATEVQAYYLVQIEQIAHKYKILADSFAEDALRSQFLKEDLTILDEFLKHAGQLAAERQQAKMQARAPDLISLIRRWGGVTIVYRKTMQASPAYRRNHEELIKALEEGIFYAENLTPEAVTLDQHGDALALQCVSNAGKKQSLPSRSIFVATGARLNVAYEFEHRHTFKRQEPFEYQRYHAVNGALEPVLEKGHVKSLNFGAFTSYQKDHYRVSFLGDTHPVFHGSVVKAMASAKRIYPEICQLLVPRIKMADETEYKKFKQSITQQFSATIEAIQHHSPMVVELTVRAPMAASKAGGGQLYRLQNYESFAPQINDSALQMEGLPLMGIPCAGDPEVLTFFIHEDKASFKLIGHLKVGDPIAVMGPTGAQATLLSEVSSLLILGDLSAIPFILSMADQFLAGKNKVHVLLNLKKIEDLYAQHHLEALSQDITYLTEKNLTERLMSIAFPKAIQQIWVIGSTELLKSFEKAQKAGWMTGIPVKASVYGPMQCMLKGVCAQCLQWQIDPETKKRTKAVYACSWQHQPFEKIDLDHLDERSRQNRCIEKLNSIWVDYLHSRAKVI